MGTISRYSNRRHLFRVAYLDAKFVRQRILREDRRVDLSLHAIAKLAQALLFRHELRRDDAVVFRKRRAQRVFLRLRGARLHVYGDRDLTHHVVRNVREACAGVQERAEQYDGHRDRTDRRYLHARVAGEVSENLTQKELDLAPVQGSNSLALRR